MPDFTQIQSWMAERLKTSPDIGYASIAVKNGKQWTQRARVEHGGNCEATVDNVMSEIENIVEAYTEEQEYITLLKVALYKKGGVYVSEKPIRINPELDKTVGTIDSDGTVGGETVALIREMRLTIKEQATANKELINGIQQRADKSVDFAVSMLDTAIAARGEAAETKAALILAEESKSSELNELIELIGGPQTIQMIVAGVMAKLGSK